MTCKVLFAKTDLCFLEHLLLYILLQVVVKCKIANSFSPPVIYDILDPSARKKILRKRFTIGFVFKFEENRI